MSVARTHSMSAFSTQRVAARSTRVSPCQNVVVFSFSVRQTHLITIVKMPGYYNLKGACSLLRLLSLSQLALVRGILPAIGIVLLTRINFLSGLSVQL